MVRSLYAGISGLRSHQVALDVTGNNIANVNTVGFKSGRATFKESMAQMLQGPSRPAGNQSGTNPLQIGLGTSIASIDTMLRQGNLQTTGQITDLALEGRAYFAFSSGNGTFYSRNGGLHLDADGYLISPTNGWRLQGKMADTFGNYPPGTTIGDLRIPWGEKAPARATTQVQFGCNLNSDSQEIGTITHTNSFLRSAALGTGRALSEVLNVDDYPVDTFNTLAAGSSFIAATELARLENQIAADYRTIERYRSRIEQNRTEIERLNDLLTPLLLDPIGNADEIDSLNESITRLGNQITDFLDGVPATPTTARIIGINELLGSTTIDAGLGIFSISQMIEDRDFLRPIVNGQHDSQLDSIASRTLLSALFDEGGNSLGIKGGDVITMQTGDDNFPAFRFTVLRDADVLPADDPNYPHINYPLVGRTLEDFRRAMEAYLNALYTADFSGNLSNNERTAIMNDRVEGYIAMAYDRDTGMPTGSRGPITIDYNTDGSFRITNNTPITIGNPEGFSIPRFGVSSSRPGSSGFVSNTFSFRQPIHSINAINPIDVPTHPTLPAMPPNVIEIHHFPDLTRQAQGVASGGTIFIPAAVEDRLADVRDAKGQNLNLKDGDEIRIGGTVGVRGRTGELEYNNSITLEDLLTEMQNAYNLPPTDGTIYERPSIAIKQAGDGFDDTIPLGAIVLRGMPGTAFQLTGLSVMAKDNNISDPPPPTAFSSNMAFVTIQNARNAQIHTTEGKVFDESGDAHSMIMTFIPLQQPGEWMWEITLAGEQRIIGGNTGRITFGVDGTPSSFTFDDNTNSFRFDPMNGSSQVDIRLDYGGPQLKTGITQYKSPTTTEFKAQDGYPMGKLEEIFIDNKGEIAGKYTNGITKAIAQIFLAEFNNPAGLLKTGDSMFAVSPNSGQAVMMQPGIGTPTTIKPGALEMSNVELETEFTNMITIQRGYQANARVITTSDSMLQELVQLVR